MCSAIIRSSSVGMTHAAQPVSGIIAPPMSPLTIGRKSGSRQTRHPRRSPGEQVLHVQRDYSFLIGRDDPCRDGTVRHRDARAARHIRREIEEQPGPLGTAADPLANKGGVFANTGREHQCVNAASTATSAPRCLPTWYTNTSIASFARGSLLARRSRMSLLISEALPSCDSEWRKSYSRCSGSSSLVLRGPSCCVLSRFAFLNTTIRASLLFGFCICKRLHCTARLAYWSISCLLA